MSKVKQNIKLFYISETTLEFGRFFSSELLPRLPKLFLPTPIQPLITWLYLPLKIFLIYSYPIEVLNLP